MTTCTTCGGVGTTVTYHPYPCRACGGAGTTSEDAPTTELTTHVEHRGVSYLITVADRPPRYGEGIWYVPADESIEDALVRVVSGIVTLARVAGVGGLAFSFRRRQGQSIASDTNVRAVAVEVEREPDEEVPDAASDAASDDAPALDAASGDTWEALADPGTLSAHERELADQGAIIPAIKAVRDRHPGMSLMDAKQMVDEYRDATRGRTLALADRGDLDVETHAIAEVDAAPLGATHGTMDLEITVMPLRVRVKFEEGGRSPYDAGVFVSVCLVGTCLRGETEDGEDHEIAWYSTLRGGWVIDKKVDISSRTYATFAIEPCAASGAHEGARSALAEGGSR